MTFETTPDNFYSVNDPLVYVVYDANAVDVTKTNYKYVANLFVEGVKVFTSRTFPNPDNNRGIFDFGAVVREYLTVSLKPVLAVNEFHVNCYVTIQEEYNGTIGGVVATSTTKTFYNHYNGRIETFTKLNNYTNQLISTRPFTIYLTQSTNKYFIPMMANDTFDVYIDGNVTSYGGTTYNECYNINIADGYTNDYDVNINAAGGNYIFNIKVICEGLYDNYILHFLNKFGGFESMLFNKASKRSFNIEKKTYQQKPYRVSGSGIVSVQDETSYAKMWQQKTTFASKFSEKLRVSTDWLTDDEYKWLYQLVVSPLVYLQDVDGTIYPVQITNTNYDVNTHLQNKLSNLSLDLEFATSYKTQFT